VAQFVLLRNQQEQQQQEQQQQKSRRNRFVTNNTLSTVIVDTADSMKTIVCIPTIDVVGIRAIAFTESAERRTASTTRLCLVLSSIHCVILVNCRTVQIFYFYVFKFIFCSVARND
jgi:hypothetical protein